MKLDTLYVNLPWSTYLHQHTYLYPPIFLPMSIYQQIPSLYVILPSFTYLHPHTYLTMSTYQQFPIYVKLLPSLYPLPIPKYQYHCRPRSRYWSFVYKMMFTGNANEVVCWTSDEQCLEKGMNKVSYLILMC